MRLSVDEYLMLKLTCNAMKVDTNGTSILELKRKLGPDFSMHTGLLKLGFIAEQDSSKSVKLSGPGRLEGNRLFLN